MYFSSTQQESSALSNNVNYVELADNFRLQEICTFKSPIDKL